MNIGNRIQKVREDNGLTRKELSGLLNVSSASLRGWEMSKHKPKVASLVIIAKTFNVKVDYLLGLKDEF